MTKSITSVKTAVQLIISATVLSISSVYAAPTLPDGSGIYVSPLTAEEPVCVEGGDAENCTVHSGGGGGGGGGGISWTGPRMPGPGTGGGGSGGGGGVGYNDGTTGTSMAFNRQPGCSREYDFMQGAIERIAETGKPEGTHVPIVVTDPNFPDGQWLKYQTTGIDHYLRSDKPGFKQVFKFNMHYMYNVSTGQVFQTKLKNSFEYGCVGLTKSL